MNEQHTELCEGLEMYVLGGLSSDEKEQFEKHLRTCPNCTEQVKELREIVDLLPMASEAVDVPEGMKQRVLQNVLGEQNVQGEQNVRPLSIQKNRAESSLRPSLWRRVVVPGLSAAVLLLAVYSYGLNQQIKGLQNELVLGTSPLSQPMKLDEAVALSAPAKDIVAKGLATIVIDAKGTHLLVQAEQLPELKGSEAYQVWLLKDGKPYNAGTFLTQQGNGALYFTLQPRDYDTVAITLEPDAKGDTPRGKIVLAAPLKQNG